MSGKRRLRGNQLSGRKPTFRAETIFPGGNQLSRRKPSFRVEKFQQNFLEGNQFSRKTFREETNFPGGNQLSRWKPSFRVEKFQLKILCYSYLRLPSRTKAICNFLCICA